MTKLGDKSVVRETSATFKDRAVVVEIHPDFVRYRLKGTQQKWDIPHTTALAQLTQAD